MSKKQVSPGAKMTRLQQSRYEREQRRRRFVILGAILVALVTVVLIVAAIVQILVIEPSRTVASVGGQGISVQPLQARMRYEQSQAVQRYSQLAQQINQLQQSPDASGNFLLQFYQQQLQQLGAQIDADQVAKSTLDAMIDDLLIRQEAAKRGIAVSPEEVQEALERQFGLFRKTLTPFPTYTPEPSKPTMTAAATAVPLTSTQATASITSAATASAALTAPTVVLPIATPRLQPTSISETDFNLLKQRAVENLANVGYNEQDLRRLIESDLYRQRLQEAIGKETATTAPHYKFDYIRFNALADAQKAADRLAKAEIKFDALISQTNAITQPAAIGSGTSIDWTSEDQVKSRVGNEVADLLSVKALNAPTPIVTSTVDGGFYILLPQGREVRELSESDLQNRQRELYDDWLNKARTDASLVRRDIDPVSVIPAIIKSNAEAFLNQLGSSGSAP